MVLNDEGSKAVGLSVSPFLVSSLPTLDTISANRIIEWDAMANPGYVLILRKRVLDLARY